jgi:hypothetical protein
VPPWPFAWRVTRPRRLVEPDVVVHDPALLPGAMRRRSNAVLVAVAAAGAALAAVAGLTLVRQRSGDASGPAPEPVEQPAAPAAG